MIVLLNETTRTSKCAPGVDTLGTVDASRSRTSENARIAMQLQEAADLLDAQGDNPYRIQAYRRAVKTIAGMQQPLREIFENQGCAGLEALPGIGHGIAAALVEWLVTGAWNRIQRLREVSDPLKVLQRVPGIDLELAQDIHGILHIHTLAALADACQSGRLRQVPGVDAQRAAEIAAVLRAMRGDRSPAQRTQTDAPRGGGSLSIAMLLDVDREYRDKAAAGKLVTIAPRHFNATGAVRLPVLHTHRNGWRFTALYSNTARAHELGRSRDWVVLHFDDGGCTGGQHTVVTEARGHLAGRRVVRGREAACRAYYAARSAPRA